MELVNVQLASPQPRDELRAKEMVGKANGQQAHCARWSAFGASRRRDRSKDEESCLGCPFERNAATRPDTCREQSPDHASSLHHFFSRALSLPSTTASGWAWT